MKRTPINKISKKRKSQLIDELTIRQQLCERAGGQFYGVCLGGYCEKCGKPPDFRGLHPHEGEFKSQGGKLSMENSKMLCGKCHSLEHGIKEELNEQD